MARLAWIVCALAIAGSPVRADAVKDVAVLVQKHLDALTNSDDAVFQATLAKGALIVEPNGATTDATRHARDIFYDTIPGKTTHELGALTAVVDTAHHVAWFQAPFRATLIYDAGGGPEPPRSVTLRISGIAVDDHGWKLAAVMYTEPMADAILLKQPGGKPHEGGPALTGDAPLGKSIASWFPSNLAAARTTSATAIASGTAPTELATGAAAGKLAAGWDKLALGVAAIDARVVGTLGFARVETEFHAKGGGSVLLVLGVIAVREGQTWRWVSLQFTPGFSPM